MRARRCSCGELADFLYTYDEDVLSSEAAARPSVHTWEWGLVVGLTSGIKSVLRVRLCAMFLAL
jgi:hypothetical protein